MGVRDGGMVACPFFGRNCPNFSRRAEPRCKKHRPYPASVVILIPRHAPTAGKWPTSRVLSLSRAIFAMSCGCFDIVPLQDSGILGLGIPTRLSTMPRSRIDQEVEVQRRQLTAKQCGGSGGGFPGLRLQRREAGTASRKRRAGSWKRPQRSTRIVALEIWLRWGQHT